MVHVVLQRITLVQIWTLGSMWFYKDSFWHKQRLRWICGSTKNHNGTNGGSNVYVVLQRITMVQRLHGLCGSTKNDTGTNRLQFLCGSTKNDTGTNGNSSVYVVLQRIILVQIISSFYVVLHKLVLVEMEVPVLRLFYKESYWYKSQLQCLCGSTQNHNGTTRDSRVYVVLQRIILVQIDTSGFRLFYKKSYWYK